MIHARTDRTGRGGSGSRKAFPAVLFLLLILCFTRAAGAKAVYADTVQAGTDEAVAMEVSYGFGDTAKGDRYLPVRVSLENKEERVFSGTIEILTTESSAEVYRYDYPVYLEAGETGQETCYIPLGIKSDQLFVTLRRQDGTQIIKKRLKLNISSDISEVFVGALCDTPEALSYLDDVGIRYGSIKLKVVNLTRDTLPEDPKGFDQLDLLLINDYNLSSLSERQQESMMKWVEDGGTLLFGGGASYRDNMGKFASELLEPAYEQPSVKEVNLGAEYSQNAPQDAVLPLVCADLSLKNGSVLIQGDGFPLLSFVHMKQGRVAAAAFDLQDIGDFCEEHPAFLEKLLTLTFGEARTNELSQMEFYGFTSLYFSAQGLINTGNVDRLPNVMAYTVIIIVYILLIGPGIYLILKKKNMQRHYITGVAVCALFFTVMIYALGMKTRFRGPFFTYATILDASEDKAEEKTYINVRSPFNKPYAVALDPSYSIRPITKSYYYDTYKVSPFTGEEDYKTAIAYGADRTELRIRDTAAFTPKLFYLNRELSNSGKPGIAGSVTSFDGNVSGTVVNNFDYRLENAALLFYGRAVLLGDMEPGQEVRLDDREIINYPLNYMYAFAQTVTGADQYEKADINDEKYMLAQERTRLLSFYMDGNMDEYMPEARFVAFSPNKNEKNFLADGSFITEGITLVTSEIPVSRERDGLIYRSALEQAPTVISGNYQSKYNSMYGGEPSEPAVVEYSLGNDLEVKSLTFATVSPMFIGNPKYPYLTTFQGKMYFYNFNTGHNDLMNDKKTVYTAEELKPYLSPSNTITIKYLSEGSNEYGTDRALPMLYVTGRRK